MSLDESNPELRILRHGFDGSLKLRPWRHVVVPGAPATMLSPAELEMLHWLTSNYYRGVGAIVDAGCFLGGSTVALASGLAANHRVAQRTGRIHSFDLFIVDWYMKEHYLRERRFKIGDSFLDLFLNNIAPYRESIEVHPGDVLQLCWTGKPIEILFLDIIKSRAINRIVLEQFFRCLIPGVSIVVQQDYVHEWLPWLHVTMEALADCFEPLDFFDFGSGVFRLTSPIPESALARCIAGQEPAEQLALMEGAIARCPAEYRARLECARVVLLHDLGQREAALEMLRCVAAAHPRDERAQLLVGQIQKMMNRR